MILFVIEWLLKPFFQEEVKQEEEKEQEFFGKLEYTLDYNFTDNQVCV